MPTTIIDTIEPEAVAAWSQLARDTSQNLTELRAMAKVLTADLANARAELDALRFVIAATRKEVAE